MNEEELAALVAAMDGEKGDLLFFAADANKVVWDVLGALRLELAKQMEIIPEDEFNFLWVTEFPLLEWDDEDKRFVAVHHPFTMPMDEDLHRNRHKVSSDSFWMHLSTVFRLMQDLHTDLTE